MVPVFQSLETISGEVSIAPVPDKRIEHMDVKIELLGQIGMLSYPQLLVLSVAC